MCRHVAINPHFSGDTMTIHFSGKTVELISSILEHILTAYLPLRLQRDGKSNQYTVKYLCVQFHF